MTGDEIGFSEISDVYRNERRSKTLTKLPANFYLKAEEHLRKLKEEHCAAILIPNNPNSMMLWDQIGKLDKRLKHIYEIRERKLALSALDNMVGAPPPDNMTKKDRALYERLVETLTTFRNHTELGDCPPPAAPLAPALEPEKIVQPKIVEPEPQTQPEEPAPEEAIIVHVLEDIPTFVSLKNTYNLKKDDMVTLPGQFARLLSSKGKVRIVGS
jgi:DNA replication initiation complex subunit (GINS family)